MKRVRLEDWKLLLNDEGVLQLCGNVYGHTRFSEGTFIYTSQIIKLDVLAGFADTLNTNYILGEKHHESKG